MDPTSFANIDEVKIQSLDIKWNICFETKVVSGTVEYKLSNTTADKLVLDTRDLHIEWVRGASGAALPHSLGAPHPKYGAPLTVTLEGADSLVLQYRTSPHSTALQWLQPAQTAGSHPFVFSQCQAIHARSLLPVQDTPSVKLTYDVEVTCPGELRALVSALPVSETVGTARSVYRYSQPQPTPPYLIALVCGELQGKEVGRRSTVWAEAAVLGAAAAEFEDTEAMLEAAEAYCGEYVWGRYGLVILPPSFPYGGMENPCLTFVTPTLLAGDKSAVDVVIHEIAHSWSGNLVSNASWEHFWLNEGFTMFIQRKVLAMLHGEPTRHFSAIEGWKHLQDTIAKDFPPGDPLTCLVPDLAGVDPDDAFSSVPYEKGHTLLWYLEEKLGGPSKFDPFIKAYIAKFAKQSIKTDQFLAFLREYFADQSQTLDAVDWQAWLHTPGMPPYTPSFDDSLARVCSQLCQQWTDLSEGETFAGSADQFKALSAPQIVEFLVQIYQQEKPLSLAKLQQMSELYSMFTIKNFEVRNWWLRVCLRSRWEEAVPHAFRFLDEQGRMKYTKPVYRELYAWEGSVREQTLAYFRSKEDQMMHVSALAIRHVLGITSK